MTDELASKNEHGRTEAEEARLDAIAARIVEGSDKIEDQISKDATITRDMLWLVLAHTDENFESDTPQDELNRQMMISIARLEQRLIKAESKLRDLGA